jgi:riboflavin transporter FmnP
MNQNPREKTRILVLIAMFSTIAFLLQLIEVPVAIQGFKYDFGDIPALLIGFSMGPIFGVMVELFKNLLHWMVRGDVFGGIGHLMNFLAGASFVAIASKIYWKKKTMKNAIKSMVIASLISVPIMVATNLIIYPWFFSSTSNSTFAQSFHFMIKVYLIPIVIFNFIKYGIASGVTFLVYKRISNFLKSYLPKIVEGGNRQ